MLVVIHMFHFENAPHTLPRVLSSAWAEPYTREVAAFPRPWCHSKLWPTVGRVDDQHGDKNLVCTCPPLTDYV